MYVLGFFLLSCVTCLNVILSCLSFATIVKMCY